MHTNLYGITLSYCIPPQKKYNREKDSPRLSYTRMLCALFGGNWPSGSPREDESVKRSQQQIQQQWWWRKTTDRFRSENITLTLDSGELNVLWMPIVINHLFYCLAVCIQWVYFIYVLHSIFLPSLGDIQYHIYHCCCYNLRMCCYKSPNRRHQRIQKDILKVKKN